MKMRKIAVFGLIAAGTLGVSACGSSSKTPGDAGTTPVTSAPAPAPTSHGGYGY